MTHPVPETATPLIACLKGRCPRCGKGRLFATPLGLAPSCTVCGLDLGPFGQGDGPAPFAITIVGVLAVGGVLALEVLYAAPWWVQVLIWLPSVPLLSFLTIRALKAWLVSEQYRHDADEGRLSDGDPP